MAEKIYPASPRKREKERKKGNVAKSADIATISTLFIAIVFIYISKDKVFTLMDKFLSIITTNMDKEANISVLGMFIQSVIMCTLPLMAVVCVAGFLANFFQVGLKFSPESIKPKFSKINPISGFKRLFSKDGFVELAKSLLKVTGVIYITFGEIQSIIKNVNNTFTTNVNVSFDYIFDGAFNIVVKIMMLLAVVTAIDFVYKKFKFEKDLKMTREEMMNEYKESEGNPQTKSRQREIGRMLMKKQIQNVKDATVLVVNPTHYAVAIKYDAISCPHPVVTFKGVDEVALEAKRIAKESNVPVVENVPLARGLYAKLKEGDLITEEFVMPIAEVIAHIYSINNQLKK